jgi:hypothetical protein
MKRRARIYVAGKLSDPAVDYVKNMHRMMETAEQLRQLGCAVFVPCLDVLMGIRFGNYEYKDYFDNSQPWLEVSNAIFLIPGWEGSVGTKREMEFAEMCNIPVFSDFRELIGWLIYTGYYIREE